MIKARITYLDKIDVGDLLRLIIVVESGSITRSAKALNTTQPTLTRRIRRLESALGRELLERTRNGVSPTAFGREVIHQALIIERALAAVACRSGSLWDGQHTEIRVGATPLPALCVVPETVKLACELHPNIMIHVTEGFLPEMLTQLRKGEIDLILASSAVDRTERNLAFKHLFDVRICVVVRSQHPVTSADHVSLPDMMKLTWALPSQQSTYWRYIEREFDKQKLEFPSKYVEMPSPSALLRLVKASDVVTALPFEIVNEEIRAGTLTELKDAWQLSPYHYGFFVRRVPPPTPAMKCVIRSFEQATAALGFRRNGLS